MNIKVTFNKTIEINQCGYTAQVNFLLCKSIELNGFGMVKIDGQYTCNELDILSIQFVN